MAERGSSDWCQVWGTQVYGQLHPLVQAQKAPPLSLEAVLPVWHETHPTHSRHRLNISSASQKSQTCSTTLSIKRKNTHLVSKGLEFTGGAGIQVHELISIYKQSCFFALVLILEGSETPPLYFQNTRQVSYVALKGQEPSPDFTEE